MLTEKQIEDQQDFERKQISGGLDKLMSNTKKLEDKTYASATVYGSACISSILPDLIAYIDKKKDKFLNQAGNDHAGFVVASGPGFGRARVHKRRDRQPRIGAQ